MWRPKGAGQPRHVGLQILARDQAVVQAISDYRLVQIFRNFARFPVIEYERQGEQQVVRYFDLRFTGYGRERSWFDLKVHLDSTGQVQVLRRQHPERDWQRSE